MTVDSHVSLTSKKNSVEVELDNIKEIRKQKIEKIGK